MHNPAKLLGHPIHQMLIPFPLGLLGTALLFDLIDVIGDGWPSLSRSAFYMIAAGIVAGLLAAVFGTIDWLAIPDGTRAKRVGMLHGLGNVVIVALFAAAWLLRNDDPPKDASGLPLVLEAVGVLGALVTGWLGGELVDRLGVGVDPGANVDAPSSLSGQPAGARRATDLPAR
jgi:uncharacterized membrane protein